MYIVAGYCASQGIFTNAVYECDLNTANWKQLFKNSSDSKTPAGRVCSAATALTTGSEKFIYMFGGYDG
jgi:hypothetical protein